ncbi:PAS domain-containing sensor histidine kinase [Colwelliaceae bacterium 6471]
MDWIKRAKEMRSFFMFKYGGDDQRQLVFWVCLPCLVITIIALLLAKVSWYLIAFIAIVLLLLSSYVIVASKYRSDHQVRLLSNLIEAMIDGDYSLRGRTQSSQAFQELLTLTNSLADRLAQHKIEAKESRLLLEVVMEQMDAIVFAIDADDMIVMANHSAHKLFLTDEKSDSGQHLASSPEGKLIAESPTGIIEFEHSELRGEHFLFKQSFLREGKKHFLFLITSAERLLIEKERKAWQSLLRVLSHEMNNSLTPIASISQSMKHKLKHNSDSVNIDNMLEGTSIIHERASSLSAFIASYSQLSHLPIPNKTRFALKPLIEHCAALFQEGDIAFSQNTQSLDDLIIEGDRGQLEQVLINIFKNAVEAMHGQEHKLIEIGSSFDEKWLELTIKDRGEGIANMNNIFVPFYSTKSQGSGIGLTLSRQILFNHGGKITLTNREDAQGAQVVLTLPR